MSRAELAESQIRKLRDNIFGPDPKYCTWEGWEACKHKWMTPENVRWLLDNQPKENQPMSL